jgi:hypothetical protein
MARFKNKKIDFDQAQVPGDVSVHRVYWNVGSQPDYASTYVEVPVSEDPVVPDDLPGFPVGVADVYVGVTAINMDGHESDMGMLPDPFAFIAPPVPIFTVVDA